jgi:hypothetical protein
MFGVGVCGDRKSWHGLFYYTILLTCIVLLLFICFQLSPSFCLSVSSLSVSSLLPLSVCLKVLSHSHSLSLSLSLNLSLSISQKSPFSPPCSDAICFVLALSLLLLLRCTTRNSKCSSSRVWWSKTLEPSIIQSFPTSPALSNPAPFLLILPI